MPTKPIEKPVEQKPTEVKPTTLPKSEVKPPVVEAKKDSTVVTPPTMVKKDSVIVPPVVKKDSVTLPPIVAKTDTVTAPVVKPEPVKDDLFNPASSSNYYFVVAVNAVNLNVSSSRFGIGQFNRGNYSGSNLRHQLKELNQDQLIIVGDFTSIDGVQQYQQNIKPQLGRIMKIPAANYTTFAISKENLEKITSRETLERYIRYINSNEL